MSSAENFDEELERLRKHLTQSFEKKITELTTLLQEKIDGLEKRTLLSGMTYNNCRICQQRPVTDPEPSDIEAAWHRAKHPQVNWFEGTH